MDLDIIGTIIEKADKVKYFGDTFNKKGNNNDLIDNRVRSGKQKNSYYSSFLQRDCFR